MGNIIVAFSKPQDGRNIRNILVKHGIQVTASCTSGAQVLASTDDLRSGIVVSGYRFEDMLYDELRQYLPAAFDMLLISSPSRLGGQAPGSLPTSCRRDLICFSLLPRAGGAAKRWEGLSACRHRLKWEI